ncbi:hypothetical protein RHSIM_Rhsim11G0094600 [Rhododendron simsii]|uniref:Uncharacterized protein n=1 Tax=Rhododendron simsii TaxID=118357 RepID=A0A834GAV6_RHOSS|nr:hypothetical protein RHSIM_Rhsim11G0094600 [Rhododendron simsii]
MQPVAVAVTDGEEFGEDGDRAGNVAAIDTEEDEVACHCVDGVDVEEMKASHKDDEIPEIWSAAELEVGDGILFLIPMR